MFAAFVRDSGDGQITASRLAEAFRLGHNWITVHTSFDHFQVHKIHIEQVLDLRGFGEVLEDLADCVADATLEKGRTDIEITELRRGARLIERRLGERADEDTKKAEGECDIALKKAETTEKELRAARGDLVAVATAPDNAAIIAPRAHEELLRKSIHYGLAARLIRELKAVKAKFEVAHANVAAKSQALAALFDVRAHGDHALGGAYRGRFDIYGRNFG